MGDTTPWEIPDGMIDPATAETPLGRDIFRFHDFHRLDVHGHTELQFT
ncbi:MAG TPA: hypothetical protein VLX61_06530 [Anaerolineales bacterium]|nr:hypothetical protein [Anaerolineales bacterium]